MVISFKRIAPVPTNGIDWGIPTARFRTLSGSTPLPMALVDHQGQLRDVNAAFARLLGATLATLPGKFLRALLHPEDVAACERLQSTQERRGASASAQWLDLRWRGGGGQWIATRTSMGLLQASAEPVAVLYVERRLGAPVAPVEPASLAQLSQRVLLSSAEPVLVADAQGRVRLASAGAADLFRRQSLVGLGLADLLAPRPDQLGQPLAALIGSLAQGGECAFELLGMRSDGSGFDVDLRMRPLELDGERLGVLRLWDQSQALRQERQQMYLSQHDPVTGLPNRALGADRLAQALRRAQREDQSVVLAYLDLDRFKHFNESLGHGSGDLLLREVASRVRGCLRESDTVARLGGDEFAVILEGDASLINAGKIARKMLDAIAEPVTLGGRELFPTASLGLAIFPLDGDNAEQLLGHAETALYRAKELGRNTYCFYAPSMQGASARRLQLEAELRHALERGEFELFYQPQIRARDGQVVGLEALLRWRREGRLIPPDQFIPVLEDTGLIVPVGQWVLETACQQAVALGPRGLEQVRVAVNVSPVQFRDAGFADSVEAVLARCGLAPERLDLEITESLFMEQMAPVRDGLQRLRTLGVRLALDDFGTGYSSLAYLKRFTVDTLKIDRGFVSGVPDNAADVAILSAIAALGEQLGLELVAEAVEQPGQLEYLQRWPEMLIQGYLFAPPLPSHELVRWLSVPPEQRLEAAAGR